MCVILRPWRKLNQLERKGLLGQGALFRDVVGPRRLLPEVELRWKGRLLVKPGLRHQAEVYHEHHRTVRELLPLCVRGLLVPEDLEQEGPDQEARYRLLDVVLLLLHEHHCLDRELQCLDVCRLEEEAPSEPLREEQHVGPGDD
jgi:hypothetical protein